MDPVTAGLSAGAGLVSAVGGWSSSRKNRKAMERMNQLNIENTRYINQQNIDWARQQYEMSKADSLERWHMENQYNSPVEQMARYRDAGLNPHLLYGTGATASNAGSIDSPEYKTPNLQAPDLTAVRHENIGEGVGTLLSTAMMQAQIEKTKAETRRIDVDQNLQSIDLELKRRLGLDSLENNLNLKMANENQRNRTQIREAETWLTAMFTDERDISKQEYTVDVTGTYNIGNSALLRSMQSEARKNPLIEAMQKAGIEKTIQEIENLKKRAVLYNDQHDLNQIEKSIRDFRKNLTDMGISPESTQMVSIIVTLLRSFLIK